MATVNFLYRSKKTSAPLTTRLLFRHNGTDYVFAEKTRCVVTQEYWKKAHNALRLKSAELKALKSRVDNELYELEKHILKSFYECAAAEIDKRWLKCVIEDYYKPKIEEGPSKNLLIPQIDNYVKTKGSDLANSTVKKYNVVKGMLLKYEAYLDKKLYISQIDLSFKQSFEEFCLNDGYAINTIAKALKIVKTICNHAKKRGAIVSQELDEIKLKSVETETVYLNLQDLQKIEETTDLPDYLDNARDWLLISCYTGARVSDFMRFEPSMITPTINKRGEKVYLLEIEQEKTDSPLSLPLSSKVLRILEKRGGNFPNKLADQVYNRFIKEVCKRAKIDDKVYGSKKALVDKETKKWRKKTGYFEKWELVTSHIGRRSFATNNYGKIPTSFLAYATGHKSEAMFLKYMRKNNKDLALELADYFS